jgi:hypothetical protein
MAIEIEMSLTKYQIGFQAGQILVPGEETGTPIRIEDMFGKVGDILVQYANGEKRIIPLEEWRLLPWSQAALTSRDPKPKEVVLK